MKNAVVFLATGFEEIEALGTIDVLRRGGVRVMMVSITGDRLVIGAHDIPVMADYLFEEADFGCVDALILPGGIPGSNHLNAHAHLKEIIEEMRKGVPLGYFTSQWFGNFYLKALDHYIKEELHAEHYMRYMDDMVILGKSKKKLHKNTTQN